MTSSSSSSSSTRESFLCRAGPALGSGVVQAVLFNPIDRALYVRVLHRRHHFLDARNFARPFQGFANAAVYRTLVGASYMFWQDTFRVLLHTTLPRTYQPDTAPHVNALLTGLLAGAVSGFSLNVLQAVKFRMWVSDDAAVTFARTVQHMYVEGGVSIFFRGCVTTMLRDSVFGIVYETLRHAPLLHRLLAQLHHAVPRRRRRPSPRRDDDGVVRHANDAVTADHARLPPPPPPPQLQHDSDKDVDALVRAASASSRLGADAFVLNLLAAMAASVLSSPLNYVRSIIYGTPYAAVPLGYVELLRSFTMQCVYIYRHGESYVDRHANAPPRVVATSTTTTTTTAATAQPRQTTTATATTTTARDRVHNNNNGSNKSCGSSSNNSSSGGGDVHAGRGGDEGSMPRRAARCPRPQSRHPRAAWRWASSRLNVGWGSLRVGVGMALGQGCFYLMQDMLCARPRLTSSSSSSSGGGSDGGGSSNNTSRSTRDDARLEWPHAPHTQPHTDDIETVVSHVTTSPNDNALVQAVLHVLARSGPLPLSQLSVQLDDDTREALAQHYRDGLLSFCQTHTADFVVVSLPRGVRLVMAATLLRGVAPHERDAMARVLAVLVARTHFARMAHTTLSSTTPTIDELHHAVTTCSTMTTTTPSTTATAAAASSSSSSSSSSSPLATTTTLRLLLARYDAFVMVDCNVERVRLHPRVCSANATATATATTTATARAAVKMTLTTTTPTPAMSATTSIMAAPARRMPGRNVSDDDNDDNDTLDSVAAAVVAATSTASFDDMRVGRLCSFVRDVVPCTFYVPLDYMLRKPRARHLFASVVYDTTVHQSNTSDKTTTTTTTTTTASSLSASLHARLLASFAVVVALLRERVPRGLVDVRCFGDNAGRVYVRCLQPATAAVATSSSSSSTRHASMSTADDTFGDDSSGNSGATALPHRAAEVDAHRYNVSVLCERVAQELRAYEKRDAHASLRLMKGFAMAQLPSMLSPALLRDLRAFFAVEDDVIDNNSNNNNNNNNSNSNDNNSNSDTRDDCAPYILVFDRMRHLFDVNLSSGVVRPWHLLPASEQPTTLTRETTPLPLVLVAAESALAMHGPQLTEQLYAHLPVLAKLQLLALYVSPAWAAPSKAGDLPRAPVDAACAALRAFVAQHSHYLCYRDALIYTPALVAAEASSSSSSLKVTRASMAAVAPQQQHQQSQQQQPPPATRTLRSAPLTEMMKMRMIHDALDLHDVLLWHGILVHPRVRALPFSVRSMGMHKPKLYATLFRTYEAFACHLHVFTRSDAPPPPPSLLQPRMKSLRALIKFMALSCLGGELDANLTNHTSNEGRAHLRLFGSFSDIARQLPMWFEVRRNEQTLGASIITYIGPLPSSRQHGSSRSSGGSSRGDDDDDDDDTKQRDDAAAQQHEQQQQRWRPVMVVNRTLMPVTSSSSSARLAQRYSHTYDHNDSGDDGDGRDDRAYGGAREARHDRRRAHDHDDDYDNNDDDARDTNEVPEWAVEDDDSDDGNTTTTTTTTLSSSRA